MRKWRIGWITTWSKKIFWMLFKTTYRIIILMPYPISKDLYSPKVDSNRENIVDRVDYAEMEIDY
ncbi:hypothetical protein Q2T40_21230 [Winogradskyella maritima]|nr:hypothetical protein [Winogradskyella maritima]